MGLNQGEDRDPEIPKIPGNTEVRDPEIPKISILKFQILPNPEKCPVPKFNNTENRSGIPIIPKF